MIKYVINYFSFWAETKLESKLDHFDHVDSMTWRLEAVLQTRANLVMKADPIVTINMKMKGTANDIVFEADPRLVDSFTEELEKALKVMKGKEARRLQKYL